MTTQLEARIKKLALEECQLLGSMHKAHRMCRRALTAKARLPLVTPHPGLEFHPTSPMVMYQMKTIVKRARMAMHPRMLPSSQLKMLMALLRTPETARVESSHHFKQPTFPQRARHKITLLVRQLATVATVTGTILLLTPILKSAINQVHPLEAMVLHLIQAHPNTCR